VSGGIPLQPLTRRAPQGQSLRSLPLPELRLPADAGEFLVLVPYQLSDRPARSVDCTCSKSRTSTTLAPRFPRPRRRRPLRLPHAICESARPALVDTRLLIQAKSGGGKRAR
jgi:hypothetical protein